MKINYNQLGAEFVIVVVGVAIALAADSWRQSLIEIQEESTYIQRLKEDLVLGNGQLAQRMQFIDTVGESAVELISILEKSGRHSNDDELILLFAEASRAGNNTGSIQHDFTYEEIGSLGKFDTIRDQSLRQYLYDYYLNFTGLEEFIADIPRDVRISFMSITGATPFPFINQTIDLSEYEKERMIDFLYQDMYLLANLRHLSAHLGAASAARLIPQIEMNNELQAYMESI